MEQILLFLCIFWFVIVLCDISLYQWKRILQVSWISALQKIVVAKCSKYSGCNNVWYRTEPFGTPWLVLVHNGKWLYFGTFRAVTKLHSNTHVVSTRAETNVVRPFDDPRVPQLAIIWLIPAPPHNHVMFTTLLSRNPLSSNRPMCLWIRLFILSKKWLQTAILG